MRVAAGRDCIFDHRIDSRDSGGGMREPAGVGRTVAERKELIEVLCLGQRRKAQQGGAR